MRKSPLQSANPNTKKMGVRYFSFGPRSLAYGKDYIRALIPASLSIPQTFLLST